MYPMPENLPPNFSYDPEHTVVVVSGLPRSGTSMMMQMLTAGGIEPCTDRKRTPDESNPRGYYEHERVKRLAHDNRGLDEARGRCIKVVAGLLPHLKPGLRYKVVFLWRDLDEVLRSQESMLGASRPPSPGAREALAQAFDAQLRSITSRLEATPEVDVCYVDYAQAVASPASTAAQVSAFLGNALNVQAAASAVDPALRRQQNKPR